MYIGTVARLPFGHYSMIMIPVVLVGLALCWGMIIFFFRASLESETPGKPAAALASMHDGDTLVPSSLPVQTKLPEKDGYLIGKTLIILTLLVGFFLYMTGPGASEWRAIGALAGAGMLLCSHRAKAAKLYQLVDWNLLLLFLGLFVVNGAMKQQGLTSQALHAVTSAGVRLDQPVTLSGVTLVLSNVVSNVPAVLLLEPSLSAAERTDLWYLLALISTWAGNLTLVGSIANLIVAESAAAYGVEVKLRTYCLVGVPLTILTVVLGTMWVIAVM
jgi:Na+/H+ antiporter NhaD/arsenite permease-like protein